MDSRRCTIAVYKETGGAETLSVCDVIGDWRIYLDPRRLFAAANQEDMGALDNCTIDYEQTPSATYRTIHGSRTTASAVTVTQSDPAGLKAIEGIAIGPA